MPLSESKNAKFHDFYYNSEFDLFLLMFIRLPMDVTYTTYLKTSKFFVGYAFNILFLYQKGTCSHTK